MHLSLTARKGYRWLRIPSPAARPPSPGLRQPSQERDTMRSTFTALLVGPRGWPALAPAAAGGPGGDRRAGDAESAPAPETPAKDAADAGDTPGPDLRDRVGGREDDDNPFRTVSQPKPSAAEVRESFDQAAAGKLPEGWAQWGSGGGSFSGSAGKGLSAPNVLAAAGGRTPRAPRRGQGAAPRRRAGRRRRLPQQPRPGPGLRPRHQPRLGEAHLLRRLRHPRDGGEARARRQGGRDGTRRRQVGRLPEREVGPRHARRRGPVPARAGVAA